MWEARGERLDYNVGIPQEFPPISHFPLPTSHFPFLASHFSIGDPSAIRTRDPLIKSQVLYQLS